MRRPNIASACVQDFGYDEVVHANTTFAASLSIGFALYYCMRAHFGTVVFGLAITTIGIAAGAIWEISAAPAPSKPGRAAQI